MNRSIHLMTAVLAAFLLNNSTPSASAATCDWYANPNWDVHACDQDIQGTLAGVNLQGFSEAYGLYYDTADPDETIWTDEDVLMGAQEAAVDELNSWVENNYSPADEDEHNDLLDAIWQRILDTEDDPNLSQADKDKIIWGDSSVSTNGALTFGGSTWYWHVANASTGLWDLYDAIDANNPFE